MKWFMSLILFSPFAYAGMTYITEYRDVEHYEDAQTRLGGYPEVNDLLRWQVLVERDTETNGIVITPMKEFAVAGLGDPIAPTEPTYIPSEDANLITLDNTPTNGTLIEVSNNPQFTNAEQAVFHQYINEDLINGEYPQVVTIVGSDGDAVMSYWLYGRTIPIESVVVPTCYVNTTKSQVYGLLTRWDNIMNNDSIGSVFISLGNLFLDSENVIIEIQTLRDCMKETK